MKFSCTKAIRTTAAVGIAAAALALAGCTTDTPAAPEETQIDELVALVPEDIAERGELLVAVNPDVPPIKFVDENGELTGFSVEQLTAAGELLGLTITFETASFDAMIPGIESGDFDILISLGDLPARQEVLRFIDYAQAGISYVADPGSGIDANDPMNLCGRTVGFARGSLTQSTTEENSAACVAAGEPAINGVPYQDLNATLLGVANGDDDVAFVDSAAASYVVTQSPELYEIVGQDYFGRYGIGFPADREDLVDAFRAALLHLVETGAYADLAEKWSMTDDVLPTFPINLADA